MDLIRLNIKGILYSQTQTGAYALILEEQQTKKKIPVVIGMNEAQSIAISMEKDTRLSRPLTHDLFKTFADTFEIGLIEVIIYELIDGVFHAHLIWEKEGVKTAIDARTSDACALAVRFNVPIFTTAEIVENAGIDLEESHNENISPQTSVDKTKINIDKLTSKDKKQLYNLPKKELETMLEQAIKKENYEWAAKIRDVLNKSFGS